MSKSKNLPQHAIVIRDYQGLRAYAEAFGKGNFRFVMVLGRAGIGKSTTLRDATAEEVHIIVGHASAYGIYMECFEHLNKPIMLDDVDGLLRMPPRSGAVNCRTVL